MGFFLGGGDLIGCFGLDFRRGGDGFLGMGMGVGFCGMGG